MLGCPGVSQARLSRVGWVPETRRGGLHGQHLAALRGIQVSRVGAGALSAVND